MTQIVDSRPAMRLQGLMLEDGWRVVNLIEPPPHDTGGHFSVSYLVKNDDGREGFLKALDFTGAFQASDLAEALRAMTEAYTFERNLLMKCREHKLSKIIMPLADGQVEVPGEVTELRRVLYLIFERADGNIRHFYNFSKNLDVAWCLRSMHNTAIGLSQLHSRGIAHQDLKPSNVLFFKKENEFKVADLGRASDKSEPFRHDGFHVAGDLGYAPLELSYGYKSTDEFYGRYGVDMYLLGSLFFFYFADVPATAAIKAKLHGPVGKGVKGKTFEHDLPYIRKAFFEAVQNLEVSIREKADYVASDIITMVQELCEPDPVRRGHPKDRNIDQFSLERYISTLNLLASKAEYQLK